MSLELLTTRDTRSNHPALLTTDRQLIPDVGLEVPDIQQLFSGPQTLR